ncbi:MAG: hypothetical protein A2Y62_15490 [Candidatus Fischerbacteria bacterium RBG_13_37_8]|uniref:Uncharacterized protein n=1 Tax=Candidatus Fischerbacteria bacterium RBG_13_37_8 TaxID=1817863 RepID=A0A1F5VKU2_9BACT|nr:MAG: hypothetical protein A2Y62_15490 [Candidatus Fischerbacteria bacterium RBG_13_37_8]
MTFFKNEPDGFRGIRWGTSVKKAKLIDKRTGARSPLDNSTIYLWEFELENYKLHGIKAKRIEYHYWDDKFERARIFFTGYDDYLTLLENLFNEYGEITEKAEFMHEWRGSRSCMLLTYDSVKEQGKLEIFSIKLSGDKVTQQREISGFW